LTLSTALYLWTPIRFKHGAFVNEDVYGETPLIAAQGHSGVVDILLRNGAQIMLANDIKAPYVAASHGEVDVLGILLFYGLDEADT